MSKQRTFDVRASRRNERMTRGEVLDVIDLALVQLGTGGETDEARAAIYVLRLLREAFE